MIKAGLSKVVKLGNIIKKEYVRVECRSEDMTGIFTELAEHLINGGAPLETNCVVKRLLDREKLGATTVGNNSAIPHSKIKDIADPIVGIGISKKGIPSWGNDSGRIHLIIMILSPASSPIVHLQILAAAASFVKKSSKVMKTIINTKDAEELIQNINKFEECDD